MIIEKREASWTAPALWRFARKRKMRRISPELFCANDNLNCYNEKFPPLVHNLRCALHDARVKFRLCKPFRAHKMAAKTLNATLWPQ